MVSERNQVKDDGVSGDLTSIIRPGEGRGLDFVKLSELSKRTGVTPAGVPRFALFELLANSLDTDATNIGVSLNREDDFYILSISDDGEKILSEADVEMIVNFANKASSKRGIYRVQRGALGNALKCIFGYTYAIPESMGLNPREVIVRSHGTEYKIRLMPDKVREVIDKEICPTSVPDDGCNVFTFAFPIASSTLNEGELIDLLTAASIINPTRKIQYDILGQVGSLGNALGPVVLRGKTSISWYRADEHEALLLDYIRADPRITLAQYIKMFSGFTGRKRQQEILQSLNTNLNHDSSTAEHPQFLLKSPISALKPSDIARLYTSMKVASRPVERRSVPSMLGVVGKATLERTCEGMGWKGIKYGFSVETKVSGDVSFSYIIEIAVFDRAVDDKQGLKVYHCINFMASMERILSASYSIEHHLGLVGIKQDSPVTILIHLISPRIEWLNYAKSGMHVESFTDALKKLLCKVLPIPKTPKSYHMKPPRLPQSWVPRGKIGDPRYEYRLSLFAGEILRIDAARTRKIKYGTRGWGYILEGLGKITKGEMNRSGRALTDCRKIGLLPIDFLAEDQDETRRFSALHEAMDPRGILNDVKNEVNDAIQGLASHTTDYWQGETYFLMMCVEKGDIRYLYEPICNRYHVPIVSSKGWSSIALLDSIVKLSMRAEARGLILVLLIFYDHDPMGLKIARLFRSKLEEIRRATGWDPKGLLIERIGLNKDDIDKYNLTWIENLKSSKGRESRDADYIATFERRKCESNALFKNDETLKAAEEICYSAIEKYYGKDAITRFRAKEQMQRDKLSTVYDDPVWVHFNEKINEVIKLTPENVSTTYPKPLTPPSEFEVEVYLDDRYYGRCPICGTEFNYDSSIIGRMQRCQRCYTSMRLKKGPP